jgi:RNA polymerase sigma-70 factor (ECF subfamily)
MVATNTTPRELFENEALGLREGLFKQALGLTHSHSDAEDLVQETYMRGLEKYQKFEPGTNLRAWLSRMLFHLFVNQYRRRRRAQSVSLDAMDGVVAEAPPEVQRLAPEVSPAEIMEDERFIESLDAQMKESLSELDKPFRDVVLLNAIGELSYKDIANRLEIPVGTVMSRLHRAREFLKKRLGDSMPD